MLFLLVTLVAALVLGSLVMAFVDYSARQRVRNSRRERRLARRERDLAARGARA